MKTRVSTVLVVALCAILLFPPLPCVAQETATDLPMWYDVSTGTPPNILLNTDGTIYFQNEESIAVDPTNPDNIVAIWRDTRTLPLKVGWGYSHDGGTSWTDAGLLIGPYEQTSDPALCVNSSGYFYAALLSVGFAVPPSPPLTGIYVGLSMNAGVSWPLILEAVHDPILNVGDPLTDKEMIVCDRTGGPTDGNIYISFNRLSYTLDTSSIWCVRSQDGFMFDDPRLVSATPTGTDGAMWSVPAVGADGRVIVAWTSEGDGAIMYDVSYDEGWTWGEDRVLQPTSFYMEVIEDQIHVFSFPALTSDMSQSPFRGLLYCAFTDKAADGFFDLYLTRSLDSGLTWTPRIRLNDDPLGNNVDQFHPWVSVNDDGVVSVVFYDRRLDVNNVLFDVWVTHSFDGGVTWTPNQRVTEVSSSPYDIGPTTRVLAEYIGIASSRLRATVAFTDTRGGNEDAYAANMPLRLFPPRLVGPADGLQTADPNVICEWDDYSIYDADLLYTLEYSTDPTFTSDVVRHSDLSEHTLQINPMPLGLYYWRVRATDPFADSSAFSEVRSLEVIPACACDCHGDPAGCDGTIDVLDVVTAVNVAFRDAPDVIDPNPQCPRTTTDVSCDGYTNVIDVVKLVNVAFRNDDPLVQFCDPCL